jgi:hypothetical protein
MPDRKPIVLPAALRCATAIAVLLLLGCDRPPAEQTASAVKPSTAAPPAAPPAEHKASAPTPEPPKPSAPAIPVTPPPVVAAPIVPLALEHGPTRYQLPIGIQGDCEGGGGGPFCGVYIVELADRTVTALSTTDGKTWTSLAAPDAKLEVSFVELPPGASAARRVPERHPAAGDTHLAFEPAIAALPAPLEIAGLSALSEALAIARGKLYGTAWIDGGDQLVEIDPNTGKFRAIALPGKHVVALAVDGDELLVAIDGKRDALAKLDVDSGTLGDEIALPDALSAACRKTGNVLSLAEAMTIPADSHRVYLGFSCYPDD